jgi:NADPH-dependent curcumin reductase CurA
MASATQVQLRRRPNGLPAADDFALRRVALSPVGEGDVLVENRFVSVDPYMRGRMQPEASYYAPWPIDGALDGDAVGVVLESRARDIEPGSLVVSEHGLRDRFVASAGDVRPVLDVPEGHTPAVHLGALGATGFTAWIGVDDILNPQPGEHVLVSTVAGAVGGVAAQLCAMRGATVLGSTSTGEKAATVGALLEIDVFAYRDESPSGALSRLAPGGIDGYFDNVGGAHLDAALAAMRVGGRIAKCGDISSYNSSKSPAGPNLHPVTAKRLLIQGYLVSDHHDRRPEFERTMHDWLARGLVQANVHVVNGLDQVPSAFLELFEGGNIGKTVVAIG